MKKGILCFILFVMLATAVAAEQPTMLGLQGRVTDSTGVPVNNGNLRATVSTTASCEQNIVYDYTFNGVVRAGLFSVLLGNDSNLNLTYNQDYFLCTYINGEIQKNLGGSNTTKFRGGYGIIGAGNLTNGTFTNGNYTFADNLSLGARLYVKNDEEFLYRVLRAPIKYKDLVDRTSSENITGDWNLSGTVTISNGNALIGDTLVNDIGASEWELVNWTNFTTRIDGSMKIGRLPPSNEYKIDYIIWSRPLRVDNNATEAGIREIGMRFNNVSTASYQNLVINGLGVFTAFKGSSFNLSRASASELETTETEMNISGTIMIRQLGQGVIYVNQLGYPYPFNTSATTTLYSGYLDGAGKLSDIQFFARPTLSGSSGADTGEINGTVLIYAHRSFNKY